MLIFTTGCSDGESDTGYVDMVIVAPDMSKAMELLVEEITKNNRQDLRKELVENLILSSHLLKPKILLSTMESIIPAS